MPYPVSTRCPVGCGRSGHHLGTRHQAFVSRTVTCLSRQMVLRCLVGWYMRAQGAILFTGIHVADLVSHEESVVLVTTPFSVMLSLSSIVSMPLGPAPVSRSATRDSNGMTAAGALSMSRDEESPCSSD